MTNGPGKIRKVSGGGSLFLERLGYDLLRKEAKMRARSSLSGGSQSQRNIEQQVRYHPSIGLIQSGQWRVTEQIRSHQSVGYQCDPPAITKNFHDGLEKVEKVMAQQLLQILKDQSGQELHEQLERNGSSEPSAFTSNFSTSPDTRVTFSSR